MQQNNEFYEDEVIEGFYVPSMVKKAWGAQLDVLWEFDKICREHDIPYFADWGSLLGAIRHQGYVPWDDDIDISMRRNDYNRFLKYAEDELPSGFKVMNYKNTEGHLFFVARVVGKPRICFEPDHLERFHGFPYIVGLDLFILDNVAKDREVEKLKAKKAEYIITVADKILDGSIEKNEIERSLQKAEEYSKASIDRKLRGEALRVRMYELAEMIFASIPDEESDALVQMMPFGMYGRSLYIPKEYYENTVRLPFMDTTISVPAAYDAVMGMKFGNYLQIKRKWDGHDYPFFDGQHKDLLKVLDFEYPAYKVGIEDFYSRKESDEPSGFKAISRAYMKIIKEMVLQIPADINLCVDLQQAALELGNYIEDIKGEGSRCVSILEELCEESYQVFTNGADIAKTLAIVAKLEKVLEEEFLSERLVLFMPFAAKYWPSMEKLHNRYSQMEGVTTKVMPIPYYYKAYDGSFGEEVFDIDKYPTELELLDYKSFNLVENHPDVVVIQNPFDEWNTVFSVSKEYYSKNLLKCTDELVYIPFFKTYDFVWEQGPDYHNMDYYVNVPGIINADKVLLPSDQIKETYIHKLLEFANEEGNSELKSLLEKKLIVDVDIYKDEEIISREEALKQFIKGYCNDVKADAFEEEVRNKKIILYFNSLSIFAQYEEKAVDKIRRCLDVFKSNKDKITVIWISDNMENENAKAFSEELRREISGLQRDYEEYKDGILYAGQIRKKDYDLLIKFCDAYYGDPAFGAMKFSLEHKPVMVENIEV